MLELQHIHKMYNPGTINEICLFEDFNLKIEEQPMAICGWTVIKKMWHLWNRV